MDSRYNEKVEPIILAFDGMFVREKKELNIQNFFLSNFCSVTQLCPTLCNPWTAACQPSLYFTISQTLLKHMSIELGTPSSHLILCHPLLLLPSIFPSIRVFSNESALCIRWPKYWRFSSSPSNQYLGLISFRIDWSDLLLSKGLLTVFYNTTVQKHQFFGTQPSLSIIFTKVLDPRGRVWLLLFIVLFKAL